MPLVAFDKQGYRLGRGKGCYDRAFQFKKDNTHAKPLLIGIGYDFQLVKSTYPEPHDVVLNQIITDKNHYIIS